MEFLLSVRTPLSYKLLTLLLLKSIPPLFYLRTVPCLAAGGCTPLGLLSTSPVSSPSHLSPSRTVQATPPTCSAFHAGTPLQHSLAPPSWPGMKSCTQHAQLGVGRELGSQPPSRVCCEISTPSLPPSQLYCTCSLASLHPTMCSMCWQLVPPWGGRGGMCPPPVTSQRLGGSVPQPMSPTRKQPQRSSQHSRGGGTLALPPPPPPPIA